MLAIIEAFPLSSAQQSAYNQIVDLWQSKQVVLLHGVTSSGKTEIYIKLIQKAINEILKESTVLTKLAP